MRRGQRVLVFIAAAFAFSIAAAQASAAQWYKADLHAHSVFSADGYADFGIISQSAKAAGFNAMFMTDHNLGSNFPISSMTANHMFFEDTMRRWETGTTGTLGATTNSLSTSTVRTGTSSLHLASTSTTAGETFIRTKRGPLLRSSHGILKFSVNAKRLDAGSGLYVSVSIGGDPTVKDPSNNPVGYTTKSGVISPGKSNVLVWYFGARPPASFYGSSRVVVHPLGTSSCDRGFALNTWVTCTIDVTAAALADIPAADQPLDYNGFKDLKMSAVGIGGTADAYFDSYTIDATSSSAEEFVFRTGVIGAYDTSTFKIFPGAEMGTGDHANRFNFGITSQSQFTSYQDGTDGIAPTQATGYPAQLNHPGVDGGVTDQAAIDTNAFGAQLLEIRHQNMIDDWDAILRKGVPLVGTWGGDNHTGRWTTGSQSTHIRADALTLDALTTALKQGRAFLSAGVTGMTFNLDGSSEPYPTATPVNVPTTQSSATVRLSIAGGITSGSTVRWLSNNGSTTTTSVLATDPTSGSSYTASKSVPLSGSSTYVRAEVRSSSGTLRGMTQGILFKRSGGPPVDTTPPTATITAPTNGSTVSGTTTVTANASDNVGVAGVQFKVDGANLGSEDTSAPYSAAWDTVGLANGSSHTITAVARDSSNNLSTPSTVSVTIDNSPPPPGSVALVSQRTAALTTSGTTLNIPIPSTAAGDTLVASFALAAGSSKSIAAVTDSAGGTWTKGPIGYQSGSNTRVELWYRSGVGSGVSSVTATLSAAGIASANVSEWSGVASVSPLDVQGGKGNAATTAAPTPTVTTTNADDLLIGALNYSGTATSTLTGGGFTALTNYNAGNVNGRAAYRTVSATGGYTATWTLSAAAASGTAVLALKAGEASPPPPDTTDPSVSVTAPSNGATVSSAVNVTASASDNVGVTSVQFTLDDADLGSADTSAPYSVSWNTTTATDGQHTLRAIASDAAGNTTTSGPAAVTVDNSTPPPPGGSIALVAQRTAALTTAGTTLGVPVQATAAGDALVASFALAAGSSKSVLSVSDSAGGTWTKGPVGFQSGSNTRVELWYRTGVPAGVTSVTATLSAAGIASANVSEWSGVAAASPLDVQSGKGNTAGTAAPTPPAVTTNADDLLIGALNYSGTATSTLTGGGFTALTNYNAGNVNGRAAYQTVSATGSYQATWTLSAAVTSGTAILALKAG